jgi:ATP-binding cassette, subfamily B, bacterial
MSLTAAALELARPWPLKLAVDHAVGNRPLPKHLGFLAELSAAEFAAVAGFAVVCLVAVGGALTYFADSLVGSAAERIGADLRSALFARLQRLSLRFHDRRRTGDLVSRLTSDVSRVQDALVARFETLLPDALMLLGMVVVLMAVDVELGVVALAVIPPLCVVAAVSRRRIKSAQRTTRSLYGGLADHATEILRNVRVVQAFTREHEELDRFRSASDATARAAVDAVKVEARYTPTSDFVLAIGSGLVLWFGVVKAARGDITVGTLLVVLSYTSSLYQPIRSLARLSTVLAKGAVSRERLVEVLDADEVVAGPQDGLDAPEGPPLLQLRDVGFAYPGRGPVLRGVSLEAGPGETLCIVGASGAGKSTLLSLILRLYDPDGGAVALDGIDLRRFKLSSLRERIALVPQDAWIVDGTIRENIAFGLKGASDADVREAAQLAMLDEFVDRLPNGFETIVGEGGTQLSGGQRRRLALARAIVRGASLLVLDEPTSGLDELSERTVLDALKRVARGRTVVIVSHAQSLASFADRVVLIEDGRIAEASSADDVLIAAPRVSHETRRRHADRSPALPATERR